MTTKFSIDKLTHKDLVELQQEITVAMARRRSEELAELRNKMAALAGESGFELSELVGGGSARRVAKRSAVAVKFRNPKNPEQTWTGRGRKPNWMVDALKKGQKMDSFAV